VVDEKTTDWLDVAAAQTERERSVNVSAIRRAAEEIPDGEPGECERCGEGSLRLVFGACARCRDKYKLK
jgi:hypothetical protein